VSRLSDEHLVRFVRSLRNLLEADWLKRSAEYWSGRLGLDPEKARQVLKAHRESD
jgi:hypothetical protein